MLFSVFFYSNVISDINLRSFCNEILFGFYLEVYVYFEVSIKFDLHTIMLISKNFIIIIITKFIEKKINFKKQQQKKIKDSGLLFRDMFIIN